MEKRPVGTWIDSEIDILRNKYPQLGPDIPELLDRHSRAAIATKACHLGVAMSRDARSAKVGSRTIYKNVEYGSARECAKALGVCTAWVCERRDKVTGVVDDTPGRLDLTSRNFSVVVDDVKYTSVQSLCEAVGWSFDGNVTLVFNSIDLSAQRFVDLCIALDIVPRSLHLLYGYFKSVDRVREFVSVCPGAIKNKGLSPGWKSFLLLFESPVSVNGVLYYTIESLCNAFGWTYHQDTVGAFRDSSLESQVLVDSCLELHIHPCSFKILYDELGSVDAVYDFVRANPRAIRSNGVLLTQWRRAYLSNGYEYVCCSACGNVYLVDSCDVVGFSHAKCRVLKPVPTGWYTRQVITK